MNYIFNPDYKLIYSKESTEELYFKHTWKDTLIQISQCEWNILSHLVKNRDENKTLIYLMQSYDADQSILNQLIQYSLETELIIWEDALEAQQKQKTLFQNQSLSNWKLVISQLFSYVSIPIEFIGRGNLRFYKVAKIPLEKTWMESWAKNQMAQTLFQIVVILLMITGIGQIIYNPQFIKQWQDFELINSPILLPFLISGLLVSTFLHEFAHYLIYLKHGGLVADLGFSFVLGFIPFVHINTNSLHFWDNQRHRVEVILAGILLDISLVLGINIFLDWEMEKIWLSHWQFLQCFIAFRIIFNAIPFIPGTDGYFLLSEYLHEPALFHEASRSIKKFKTSLFQLNVNTLKPKDYLFVGYILMSYCFISAYYCLLALWIILPYFIRFIP
ncbi:hypothetical protein [Aquirufa ecclesiirivi]|uniref:hypothetical protein n=1 Tax=Aquirufa ecclesiirivi TaxID=2715124 RepID=UPI003BB1D1AE